MKNEQYWLITYIKEYENSGNGVRMPETISKTIDIPWERFVSNNGIKAVVFLKEITKDEWGFAPF